RLEELHAEHGKPVSLLGQSLGGIFARVLARQYPGMVRQVITLGSPYRMMLGDRSSVQRLFEQLSYLHISDLGMTQEAEEHRAPLTMPATSIYSRTDGVAPWQTCIDKVGPMAENI
ncbi:MAG TPA: hypothetical protein PLV68_16675, partial [Ilumatobacteraceae bacterium]|nr:hypothetical protein [Ilumatobacteraceae bacterium]